MKKLFNSFIVLTATVLMLTSCEDVPAPYELPWDGTILKEAFTGSSYGDFSIITPEGVSWSVGSTYIQGSGYNSATKTNTVTRSYLISPEIDLSTVTSAYLQFKYIFRYASNEGENKVLITDSYTGNPETTEWTDITGQLTESSDWNTWSTYARSIPKEFIGKKNVQIAFFFSGTDKGSRTWELKLLYVKQGEPASGSDEPEYSELEDGQYLNESFEKDFGRFNPYTIKGQPWTISYSTAKASGYVSSSKSNVESEAYIVSIPVDLTASKGAMLEFDVLSAYPDNDGEMRVLVTDNFNENEPNAAQWVDITGNTDKWATGDFNTFVKYQADIPAQFIGKDNVRVALYYTSPNTSSKTWEVKNLIMKEGQVPPAYGTYELPYTVAMLKDLKAEEDGYAKGFIVGYVNDNDIATLSAEGAKAASWLLIADAASETNPSKMAAVYLNLGQVRNNISLNKKPENLGKEVILYGKVGAVKDNFKAVNNVSYAEIDGSAYGTKPEK